MGDERAEVDVAGCRAIVNRLRALGVTDEALDPIEEFLDTQEGKQLRQPLPKEHEGA